MVLLLILLRLRMSSGHTAMLRYVLLASPVTLLRCFHLILELVLFQVFLFPP